MGVKAIGHVWDLELPANKRLVLLAYADHADHEGHNIWPSIRLIAWKTGYSERQVKRITKQLIHEDGILIEVGRGPKGVKRYQLNWNAGIKKAPYEEDKLSPKETSDNLSPKAESDVRDNLPPKADPPQPSDILSKESDILSSGGDAAMSPKPSLEPSLEPSLKDKAAAVAAPENIFTLWELAFGEAAGGQMLVDELKDIQDEYPLDWIREALKKASLKGNVQARAPYVRAVLEGWRKEGRSNPAATPSENAHEKWVRQLQASPYAQYYANSHHWQQNAPDEAGHRTPAGNEPASQPSVSQIE